METQTIAEILTKYRENKLAHAYLIETNNIEEAVDTLKNLIKNIICDTTYTPNCQKCNLCNLVNLNNLPSLKIIEPDGAFIKKNQIEELKETFSTIPLYSKYNIYIVKNAEKLNPSSANSMLKFIEEPTPGILGFFLTTNKDIMIDTIKSRCQIYTLNFPNKKLMNELNISEDLYNSYQETIKEYLNLIHSKKIINHKNLILTKYPERKSLEDIFKIMLEIYHQNYLKQNNQPYNSEISDIYPLQNSSKIFSEMQILSNILVDMSYNINIELILDKFVIEMRGVYE